ncbi:NAD(P)-dependent oxidoreductase [Pseudomonas fluorescens]|uniref:NAD(P)-dependent oxidoreductase n=1 Tax=Pseudomonas fluorescens TaxID=294 RepID=A0A327NCT7_PSEFL|nr:SDR family oxidoreductase [Pseudomonas fluorescens]RAI72503.1 NAD(P)-dependent oxidoreductase [Pseudomonas fluorescens]
MTTEPKYNFNGSVVLVTGAAAGLGRDIAMRFGASGASVVVTDLPGHPEMAAVVDAIKAAGGSAIGVGLDVTVEKQVADAVAAAVETFGKLDILVNNAALSISHNATELEESDFDRVVAVNLKGPWLCAKHAGRHMMKRGGGRIISIGSTSSLVGVAGQVNYQSSKHGLIGQVRTLALEFATANITVNAVCPTLMRTKMGESLSEEWMKDSQRLNGPWSIFPDVDMIETRDVAHAVLWLASDAARYVTGIALPVDAGFTCK